MWKPTGAMGSLVLSMLALISLLQIIGCFPSGIEVAEQTVTVACGRCIFKMEEAVGCPWAAEVDGNHYLVSGTTPHGLNNHAPDGICNMRREAVVEGAIRNGIFVASEFELLPAKDVPEKPEFAPDEAH
jgi:hypothetical protein